MKRDYLGHAVTFALSVGVSFALQKCPPEPVPAGPVAPPVAPPVAEAKKAEAPAVAPVAPVAPVVAPAPEVKAEGRPL